MTTGILNYVELLFHVKNLRSTLSSDIKQRIAPIIAVPVLTEIAIKTLFAPITDLTMIVI